MTICSFKVLEGLTLNGVEGHISEYITQSGPWLKQFDTYFWTTRLTAIPKERFTRLLEIVRRNGWNMNRQGQCSHIVKNIKSGIISETQLREFWGAVDGLPDLKLRDLPHADPDVLRRIEISLDTIRKAIRNWHKSAGSICFLTKVILMFNWGQSPAYDTRVRSVLKLKNDMSTRDLILSFIEMGAWIKRFEKDNGVKLDEFSSGVMKREFGGSLHPLPLGRSFDMLLYSLAER